MSKAGEILKETVAYIKKHKRYPSFTDMKRMGITPKSIEYHFTSITKLKDEAYKQCRDVVFDLEQEIYRSTPHKGIKNFVITTAVLGDQVMPGFLASIKTYCKMNKAELIVIPAIENLAKTGWTLDPSLRGEIIVTDDLSLNDNAFILGIQSKARTADPVTGLPRIGQRNGSFISASPKQRLKFVATGANSLPHALMSTGAITLPSYTNAGIMTSKATYTANHDHVMGAIILELDKDNLFHFRQIQADRQGQFADLGMLYKPGKRTDMPPEAMIMGDWHSGETDPSAETAWRRLGFLTKAKSWVVHDGYSSTSTNHHIDHKHLSKTNLAERRNSSIARELLHYRADLMSMLKIAPKLVIVKSNHDEHLERYLQEGRYVTDPENHRISLKLASAMLDGHNPIEWFITQHTDKKITKDIKWLKRDESYKVAGIELGQHGDHGANGAKGSITSLEQAYGNGVFGHTHSPEILRGAWRVGTSSLLQLDYNRGASSWFHTSCLVYPNGQRQLINSINGKFTNE